MEHRVSVRRVSRSVRPRASRVKDDYRVLVRRVSRSARPRASRVMECRVLVRPRVKERRVLVRPGAMKRTTSARSVSSRAPNLICHRTTPMSAKDLLRRLV